MVPALALLGGILLFVIFDKPQALPPGMILPPGPLSVKSGFNPYPWISKAKWAWLKRACMFVVGRQRLVIVHVGDEVYGGTSIARTS